MFEGRLDVPTVTSVQGDAGHTRDLATLVVGPQWIDPGHPWKPSEIGVSGIDREAVFDGQGCQLGVWHQVAGDRHLTGQSAVLARSVLAGWRDPDDIEPQPLLDNGECLLSGQRIFRHSGVSGDAEKRGD